MKKIILIAALGVAGLVSAKNAELKNAENQIEKKELINNAFQLCGVNVNFYDSEGNWTGSQWFLTDVPTYQSCQAFQIIVKFNLMQAGYSITAE